jgi:hypothetical protein
MALREPVAHPASSHRQPGGIASHARNSRAAALLHRPYLVYKSLGPPLDMMLNIQ